MQPGDEPPEPFSFLTERITRPQIACGDHPHHRGDPRDHPGERAPLAHVLRPDPEPRARATAPRSRTRSSGSASATATRSSWSRKAWTTRRSIPTASRPRSPRRSSAPCSPPSPGWRTARIDPAGLRHRIRLRRSARARPDPGDQAPAGPVSRRPDQRHHRLRGGGRPGPGGRAQRRRARRRGGGRSVRPGRKPISG